MNPSFRIRSLAWRLAIPLLAAVGLLGPRVAHAGDDPTAEMPALTRDRELLNRWVGGRAGGGQYLSVSRPFAPWGYKFHIGLPTDAGGNILHGHALSFLERVIATARGQGLNFKVFESFATYEGTWGVHGAHPAQLGKFMTVYAGEAPAANQFLAAVRGIVADPAMAWPAAFGTETSLTDARASGTRGLVGHRWGQFTSDGGAYEALGFDGELATQKIIQYRSSTGGMYLAADQRAVPYLEPTMALEPHSSGPLPRVRRFMSTSLAALRDKSGGEYAYRDSMHARNMILEQRATAGRHWRATLPPSNPMFKPLDAKLGAYRVRLKP